MHLGALDDANPPQVCQELANTLPSGYPIEVKVYPNARHSFDRADLPARQTRRARGGSIGYDGQAALLAWDETRKFLAKHLKAE
jgi:dienelactone hydrolase